MLTPERSRAYSRSGKRQRGGHWYHVLGCRGYRFLICTGSHETTSPPRQKLLFAQELVIFYRVNLNQLLISYLTRARGHVMEIHTSCGMLQILHMIPQRKLRGQGHRNGRPRLTSLFSTRKQQTFATAWDVLPLLKLQIAK